MMRNIETFPSKQIYPYLSLAERKVAEFYLNIDRMRWLVLVEIIYFRHFFWTIPGVLGSKLTFISRPLTANYLAMFKVISTTIYT